MDSAALVQLALQAQSCSQKELALRLGVSPTQISKWKNGEHMSHEMDVRIRAIAEIGEKDPVFILMSGSRGDAEKWEKLIHYLAEGVRECAETGYDTYPLENDLGLLCRNTFDALNSMGVSLPSRFPAELDFDYDHTFDGDESDLSSQAIESNPYSATIEKIYSALNDVWGFYAAYVRELIDDDLDLVDTDAENIEPCLIDLAASKIEVEPKFAPKFSEFRHRTKEDYVKWLTIVKDKAFRTGVPLRAELLDMVFASHEKIGHQAEAESLGLNASRLHPDMYMNELLCGMRAIHQVLPAILKKLGIDEEFKIDPSEFHIGGGER